MMDIKSFVRKNIQKLKPYSSAREEFKGENGIFLDANENPYGEYNRYPDPYQTLLKAKIAALKNVAVEQIFIGNGSDEAIDIAFRVFCEPYQDKALCFTPTYGMYEVSANINAVKLYKLSLTENFQIDIKSLIPYLDDAALKLIFICSPNNPTGNLLNKEDIVLILKAFKGIVVLDEAYIDFCSEASFLSELEKFPNLIVLQTLSKAWGLAGIRVGIAMMNPNILAFFNKVKPPYNLNAFSQKQAYEVLCNVQNFEDNRRAILLEREKMVKNLSALKKVKKIYPSDANFLLVQLEDANAVYNQLIAQKIIVRNRSSVVKNCIRISIGTPEENQQFLKAFKKI